MILTASKYVNARIGSPSTSANNPVFLRPGDKVNIVCKVIGEVIEGNDEWLLADSDQFFWSGGFEQTEFIQNIEYYANIAPPIFKALNISKLWEIARGEGIKIGIIDGGVQKDHPSLRGKVIELNVHDKPIPRQLHATAMACIIASLDMTGEIGIAPMVDNIYSYAVNINDPLEKLFDDLVEGLNLMRQNDVNIINISINLHESYRPTNPPDKLESIIQELATNNCIVICATGNQGDRDFKYFPAGFETTISVSGFNDNFLETSSNAWKGVTISMPIQSYFPNTPFETFSNLTSGGTAILSGCIACTYNQIKNNQLFTFKSLFKNFLTITYKSGRNNHINIPQFNLTQFVQHFNSLQV